MVYVPLGYKNNFAQLSNLSEVHGGSPWGAGTFASGDGSRQPSPLELEIAEIQGKTFTDLVSKVQGIAWLDGSKEGNGVAKKEEVTTKPQSPATGKPSQPVETDDKKDEEGGPCGLPKSCSIL